MSKPLVAIVGRPNVGTSMLFNKLAGKRLSIVEDEPGVTRDRLYADTDWNGREFTMVDTGGIEPKTNSEILRFIREQAEIAIATADVIVLVTDIHTGAAVSGMTGGTGNEKVAHACKTGGGLLSAAQCGAEVCHLVLLTVLSGVGILEVEGYKERRIALVDVVGDRAAA